MRVFLYFNRDEVPVQDALNDGDRLNKVLPLAVRLHLVSACTHRDRVNLTQKENAMQLVTVTSHSNVLFIYLILQIVDLQRC